MAVSVDNITVSFPGIRALDNVSLNFIDGHVHGVLGANGSGKSTLVKVLTGVYQPDEKCGSKINVDDKCVSNFQDPSASKAIGISVVHQEAPLINVLSVAESVALFNGYPKSHTGLVDWKKLYKYTEELFAFYNIDINPRAMVSDLSAAERGMVAMSIALGKDEDLARTKVLILDEADASIPESEAQPFLEHVKKISGFGIPVIMVTHRLKAVKAICDDVTILNDGKVTFTGSINDISETEIIDKMLRQDQKKVQTVESEKNSLLQNLWSVGGRTAAKQNSENTLEVKDLIADNINGLSFKVKRGEILGFVGVGDSGVSELPMVLFGDKKRYGGEVYISGEKLPQHINPRQAIKKGLMLQPTDRLRQGGVMSVSLRDNLQLPNEMNFWHKSKKDTEVVEMAINEFDIRPKISNMPFGKFSGGNQQKAIIAKWLKLRPSVLIMDDPTYGVDPAARMKIFASIKNASENGVSVVMFSTEPEQLAYVCTRIIVMNHGKIMQELHAADGTLTRESIARWCYV